MSSNLTDGEDYQGKVVLCNVFYLRGSPENKEMIEERTVKLPTSDPRYAGELKYKAYHLSLVTIETIINRKLPFLLPFVVEFELRCMDATETDKATQLLLLLRQQIDEHESALTQMIEALTDEQMESLRTTVEYLWGKSYSKEAFNKSTLLKLMREQLNFRQNDIRWGRREGQAAGRAEGRAEGRTEGIAERTAKEILVFQQMLQEGKLTQTQMEELLKRLEANELPKT
jgi:predicted transposase YdaD